jgi:hypothetical protein
MTTIVLIAIGGVLTMAGSALPWMSMFAGLKQYSGLLGLNGWLLLVLGLALALVPLLERRGIRTAPLAIVMSIGAMSVVAYAGSGLLSITGDMGHALMVPRVGPGLPVALLGCALSFAAAVVAQRHTARR